MLLVSSVPARSWRRDIWIASAALEKASGMRGSRAARTPKVSRHVVTPVAADQQPFARQASFPDFDDIDPFIPKGAVVAWEYNQDGGEHHLLLVPRRPEVQVLVTAETGETAERVLAEIRGGLPGPSEPGEQARVSLWSAGSGGSPTRYRRWMEAPRWGTISRNYPADVYKALSQVMSMEQAQERGGRLLLWYG